MKNRILVEVNDVLKEVTEMELNELVKNLYSISSCGFWEDKYTTVILVEANGVLNTDMAGFWCVRTDEKLEKYYGYKRGEY